MDPYALGLAGLRSVLPDEPAYRARQVHDWLVRGVDDPHEMTDLPKSLRKRLAAEFDAPPRVLRHTTADDGLTHKVLLEMPGGGSARPVGGEQVESVLMLYPRTAVRKHPRATVCISTQAGCAMGCPFCATGQAGFRGQLGVGQIVRQVTVMQRMLASGQIVGADIPDHVTNVVFMGMGEPLANLEPTVAAVRWLCGDGGEGFGLSARSITVSTVGLVPGIRRLTRLALPITLAVSLHAPNDALRDDLVPVNRQHPLAELMAASREYRRVTGRRLTFEYILIDGINDSVDHARELADLILDPDGPDPSDAHVNLIPMNATPAVPWHAPDIATQRAFAEALNRAGVPATIRHNRGGTIDAACGQLYAEYQVASGKTLPSAVGAADRLALAAGRRV